MGDKIEVHLDGGIRSGQDILKAIAMGAKGTYIGRPYIYGLGLMAKSGVKLALGLMQNELDIPWHYADTKTSKTWIALRFYYQKTLVRAGRDPKHWQPKLSTLNIFFSYDFSSELQPWRSPNIREIKWQKKYQI